MPPFYLQVLVFSKNLLSNNRSSQLTDDSENMIGDVSLYTKVRVIFSTSWYLVLAFYKALLTKYIGFCSRNSWVKATHMASCEVARYTMVS